MRAYSGVFGAQDQFSTATIGAIWSRLGIRMELVVEAAGVQNRLSTSANRFLAMESAN